jgi:hypothetical protein
MNAFARIPSELKFLPQWIVWRLVHKEGAKKPTKVPYSPTFHGLPASVTNPASWGTFDQALATFADGTYQGIGFVLTYDDPYTFIDLDDAGGDQAIFDRQQRVFSEFQSYAERSPSGTGLHIIVRGRIGPPGRKRAQIEVYSGERFMTMTGDVYRDAPIVECQEKLSILYDQMGGPAAIYQYGKDQAQRDEDGVVIGRAMDAANGAKFRDLFEGNWDRYYASQSEADFALVDIVAFYTQNREQIARIFRASALGQRDKAKRDDYLSAMTNRAFDRQLPEVDVESLQSLDRAFAEMLNREQQAKEDQFALPGFVSINGQPVYPASEEGKGAAEGPAAPTYATPGKDRDQADGQYAQDVVPVNGSSIIFPPGLVGAIAEFIYAAAPRPVPEIALVGAIGLVAGIVGRAYNISGAGLNQYVLALAPTGTGKEAINSGVMKLVTAVRGDGVSGAPSIMDYIGPGDTRSDAALIKWLAKHPCFVSIQGEWGMRLKKMAAPNANANEIGVRGALMDLWGKSGHGNVLNPLAYSDKEKNTASVTSPSFTLIGESTPERFYEALDETLIADGLLPRFLTIEYAGKRPANNEASANAYPSFALIDMMRTIVAHVQAVQAANNVVNVELNDQAVQLMKDFDRYADTQINGANSRETNRHMWNRAHLKALKLAAIVAVGLNPHYPVVDLDCAQWATDLVVRDITNILERFERGEVGSGAMGANEAKQIADMIGVITRFMRGDGTDAAKYGIPGNMHMQGVFTLTALTRRLMAVASFRNDRMGATNAIKRSVQHLLDGDEIRELPKSQMNTMFGTTARAFTIAKPSTFQ